MAKTETKSKFDFIIQINEKWKREQQCYDDAKVEGKDSRTGNILMVEYIGREGHKTWMCHECYTDIADRRD